MPPLEAVLIGAGQRGTEAVGAYARRNPETLKFVAVAEPIEAKRTRFAEQHNISPDMCFESYEDLFDKPQIAPLCFNTTMDRTHLPSALMALEKGYDLFLEKPMADTPEACKKIVETAMNLERMVQICHPLRYTAFYQKIKHLIADGTIGDVVSLSMDENVCYWHYAHSFVRGNWSHRERSGPFILTKCCHDMDIATWLCDQPVKTVSSFGSLQFFHEGNAPEGAPPRCTDGCPVEDTCPFYAPAFYLGEFTEWPVSVVFIDPSPKGRRKILEQSPYGRCVFRCDNDVADHQVVNAEFENGVTFNFAVRALSSYPYRSIHVVGTKGEIRGHFEKCEIATTRFTQEYVWEYKPEIIRVEPDPGAHMGGDTGVINNFLRRHREHDYDSIAHSLEIALEGHLLAFAAEQARLTSNTVALQEYKESLGTNTGD